MPFKSYLNPFSGVRNRIKNLKFHQNHKKSPTHSENPSITRGLLGINTVSIRRLALLSRDVFKIMRAAGEQDDGQTAAMAAVSRLFLLRVPSEAAPLEWDGAHSKVTPTTD